MILAQSHPDGSLWIGILLVAALLGYGIFEGLTCNANPKCARGLVLVYAAILFLFLGLGFMKQFPNFPFIATAAGISALLATAAGCALAGMGLHQQTLHRRFRRGTFRGVLALVLGVLALFGLPALRILKKEIVAETVKSGAIAATTPVPTPEPTPTPVPLPVIVPTSISSSDDDSILSHLKRPIALGSATPRPKPIFSPEPRRKKRALDEPPESSTTTLPVIPYDTNEPLVFKDRNFQFGVPQPWVRVEAERLNPSASVALQCETPNALFMLIADRPGIESKISTDSLVALTKNHLKDTDSSANFTDQKQEKVNGVDFAALESVIRINDLSLFYVHWLTVVNGYAYQLVLWGEEKNRDALRGEARKLAETFRILDPSLEAHKPDAPAAPLFPSR